MVTELHGLTVQPQRVVSVFRDRRVRVWTAGETSAVAPLRFNLLVAGVVPLGPAGVRQINARRIGDALRLIRESPLPLSYTVPDSAELIDADDDIAESGARRRLLELLDAVQRLRALQRDGRSTDLQRLKEQDLDALAARIRTEIAAEV